MTDSVTLDEEQERVASARPDENQIVIAGPGAGKSEVVGERCRRLTEHGLYPEEIFVISFSNAAVSVVRARTRDVVEEGRGVDTTTIDSLAARVRNELEDTEPTYTAYDASIEKATRLLRRSDEPVFPDVRHVVVDEVQDVVGIRADFLLTLLEVGFERGVGFTLLGDPMQGLYDFQLSDEDGLTSEQFLDTVRRRFEVEETTLTGEYRSRTPEARRVALVRPELTMLPAGARLLRLTDVAAELPPLGGVDEDLADDVRAWTGTTAFLTDTNARAGLVAAQLAAYGVPVELAASATDPSLAPWIGMLLERHPVRTIERSGFLDLADKAHLPDPEASWRTLVKVAGSRRGLDLSDLAAGLRSRRYPLTLLRKPTASIIASTVHRAKGLEFANVVLVEVEDWHSDDERASAHRLFVAMSRARSRLSRCRGISSRGWRKDHRSGTWLQQAPRGRGTLGFLMEPSHARALGPTSDVLKDRPGSPVRWTSGDEHVTVDGESIPSWVATVDGDEVARTGEELGLLIRRLSFGGRVPNLRGGRVEGLETVVGPPDDNGTGRHGFWTGARVSGPVHFEWGD